MDSATKTNSSVFSHLKVNQIELIHENQIGFICYWFQNYLGERVLKDFPTLFSL